MKHRINVLVTGAGGAGVGSQVLKALRIAKTPYNIVATDVTEFSSAFCQSDKAYVAPPARDAAYISEILGICQKERIKILVPGSEQELTQISANRGKFGGILLLINTAEVVRLCMDKWETYKFLRDNGFNAPKSLLLESEASSGVAKAFKVPAVIKPAQESFGSSNVFLAQDLEEILFFARYLRKQGVKPIVQEYVGSCEEEYTVGVLTDMRDGNLIGSMALKRQILSGLSNRLRVKNRLSISDHSAVLAISSGVSQGVIDDYPDVRDCCERIALKLGSRGAMNIQCRVVDGKVYPFEINPRHSGTTYLRAMMGFNEPDILIRWHILGDVIPSINFRKGVIMRGTSEFLLPLCIGKHENV